MAIEDPHSNLWIIQTLMCEFGRIPPSKSPIQNDHSLKHFASFNKTLVIAEKTLPEAYSWDPTWC